MGAEHMSEIGHGQDSGLLDVGSGGGQRGDRSSESWKAFLKVVLLTAASAGAAESNQHRGGQGQSKQERAQRKDAGELTLREPELFHRPLRACGHFSTLPPFVARGPYPFSHDVPLFRLPSPPPPNGKLVGNGQQKVKRGGLGLERVGLGCPPCGRLPAPAPGATGGGGRGGAGRGRGDGYVSVPVVVEREVVEAASAQQGPWNEIDEAAKMEGGMDEKLPPWWAAEGDEDGKNGYHWPLSHLQRVGPVGEDGDGSGRKAGSRKGSRNGSRSGSRNGSRSGSR
jgi:hypothetical protein